MKYLNKTLIFPAIFTALIVTISGCNTAGKPKTEDFTVNINSPKIEIGEIELQTETMLGLGKLKKQNATVSYYPREDAVCLMYRYEFFNYHQFWNRRGRLGFISALQSYNLDYDTRDLQRTTGKTLKKYDTVRGYLIWQQLSITVRARANMNLELGYAFKDNAPYFTVQQRSAEYIDETSKDNSKTSPNIIMHFTRAQAAELAELFELYMTADFNINIPDTDSVEYDEYDVPAGNSDIPKDGY
jgi:hypothetical protein